MLEIELLKLTDWNNFYQLWQEICRKNNLELVKLQTSIEKVLSFISGQVFKKLDYMIKKG